MKTIGRKNSFPERCKASGIRDKVIKKKLRFFPSEIKDY
ncbi:hypothetical protein B4135_3092 [Caldibacillus debilis]|uniref:Uncharacterized protein n=1 Tax=Caldibacillus debilis TaxID=301148 RepID=A0A150LIN0_9BACI|nr:hypothetical protein B4135_3092 [Caldibacillus debilis]